jgi:RecB family exonuclease
VTRPSSGRPGLALRRVHHQHPDPGQLQWLDARHRTQAHIEDKMKEVKACGAENLPSKDWDRNSAWLQLAALATSLNAWLRHISLDGDLAHAEPKPCATDSSAPPPATASTPAPPH